MLFVSFADVTLLVTLLIQEILDKCNESFMFMTIWKSFPLLGNWALSLEQMNYRVVMY